MEGSDKNDKINKKHSSTYSIVSSKDDNNLETIKEKEMKKSKKEKDKEFFLF